MLYGKIVREKVGLGFFLLLLFAVSGCVASLSCSSNSATKPAAAAAELPKHVLGISVGMSKEIVEPRLRQIAEFERNEGKRQQLWRLKNDARFSHIAVGFDDEQQIRYVTGFVTKETAKERIRFDAIGDIEKSTKEIVAPHHRYIWQVAGSGDQPAYLVNAYGMDTEFLTMLTLSDKNSGESEEEMEKEIK